MSRDAITCGQALFITFSPSLTSIKISRSVQPLDCHSPNFPKKGFLVKDSIRMHGGPNKIRNGRGLERRLARVVIDVQAAHKLC